VLKKPFSQSGEKSCQCADLEVGQVYFGNGARARALPWRSESHPGRAEVALPRQIFAEILSLISRLRAPSRHESRGASGEERGVSGANKRGTFGVSLLSTAGFNRLLPATTAICPCPSRSQA
jgi:hypothetical protein